MKKIFNICLIAGVMGAFVGSTDVVAASSKSGKKQAAISIGTKVRAKVDSKGLYDQKCYDQYYGCMDHVNF